jgi:uncharacterized membrane protein YqjE
VGAAERSFGNVLEDILGNFQAIIRAEVRLAKTEVERELKQGQSAALVLALGALAGAFAVLFTLLACVYALSQKMPNWAAALVVALGLAICAWAGLTAGIKKFKQIEVMPKTTATLKE